MQTSGLDGAWFQSCVESRVNYFDLFCQSLGQVGKVVNIQGGYDVVVAVNGRRWVFNPRCVVAAPGETPLEIEDGKTEGKEALKLVP